MAEALVKLVRSKEPKRQASMRHFYTMYPARGSWPPMEKLLNENKFDLRITPTRDFADNSEPALFQVRGGKSGIRDVENLLAYWLISDRAKRVFESTDPEGFVFQRCITQLYRGAPGPDYWLCSVTRVLASLCDPTITSLPIGTTRSTILALWLPTFYQDVPIDQHVFHLKHGPGRPLCDDIMKDACNAVGLTNLAFNFVESVKRK